MGDENGTIRLFATMPEGPSPSAPRKFISTSPVSRRTMVSDREGPGAQQRTCALGEYLPLVMIAVLLSRAQLPAIDEALPPGRIATATSFTSFPSGSVTVAIAGVGVVRPNRCWLF